MTKFVHKQRKKVEKYALGHHECIRLTITSQPKKSVNIDGEHYDTVCDCGNKMQLTHAMIKYRYRNLKDKCHKCADKKRTRKSKNSLAKKTENFNYTDSAKNMTFINTHWIPTP